MLVTELLKKATSGLLRHRTGPKTHTVSVAPDTGNVHIYFPFSSSGFSPLDETQKKLLKELHLDTQDLWTDFAQRKDLIDLFRKNILNLAGIHTSIKYVKDPNNDIYVLKDLHDASNRDKHIRALFENNPLLFKYSFENELISAGRILFKHILFLELLERKNSKDDTEKVIGYLHSVPDEDSKRVKKSFLEERKRKDKESYEWAQIQLDRGIEPPLKDCIENKAFSYFNYLRSSGVASQHMVKEWTEQRLKALCTLCEVNETTLPLLKQTDEVERRLHEILGNKNFTLISDKIPEELIPLPDPRVQEIFDAAIEKTVIALAKVRDEELLILNPLIKQAKPDRRRLYILGGIGAVALGGSFGLSKYLEWRSAEDARIASLREEKVRELQAMIKPYIEIDTAVYNSLLTTRCNEMQQELKSLGGDLTSKYFRVLAEYLQPAPQDDLVKKEASFFLGAEIKDFSETPKSQLPHILRGVEEMTKLESGSVTNAFRGIIDANEWYLLEHRKSHREDPKDGQVRPTYGQMMGANIIADPGAKGAIINWMEQDEHSPPQKGKDGYEDWLGSRSYYYQKFRVDSEKYKIKVGEIIDGIVSDYVDKIKELKQLVILLGAYEDEDFDSCEKKIRQLVIILQDDKMKLDEIILAGAKCIVRFDGLHEIISKELNKLGFN